MCINMEPCSGVSLWHMSLRVYLFLERICLCFIDWDLLVYMRWERFFLRNLFNNVRWFLCKRQHSIYLLASPPPKKKWRYVQSGNLPDRQHIVNFANKIQNNPILHNFNSNIFFLFLSLTWTLYTYNAHDMKVLNIFVLKKYFVSFVKWNKVICILGTTK